MRFCGFIACGIFFIVGPIIRILDAESQALSRVLLLVLIVGFVGQFVLSWRRSNGFEVLVLLNFGCMLIFPVEASAQLFILQLGVLGLILYMYPSILFFRRNHKRKYLYALLNLILGVWVVPWIIILRIALKTPRISKKRFH